LKPSSRRHILEITCYCESAKVAEVAKAANLFLVAVSGSFSRNPYKSEFTKITVSTSS
jgi:hypothetical protein